MLVPDSPDLDSDGRSGADDVAQNDDDGLLDALDLGTGDPFHRVGPRSARKMRNKLVSSKQYMFAFF